MAEDDQICANGPSNSQEDISDDPHCGVNLGEVFLALSQEKFGLPDSC